MNSEQPTAETKILKKGRGKNKIKDKAVTAETIKVPSIKDKIEVTFTF